MENLNSPFIQEAEHLGNRNISTARVVVGQEIFPEQFSCLYNLGKLEDEIE